MNKLIRMLMKLTQESIKLGITNEATNEEEYKVICQELIDKTNTA